MLLLTGPGPGPRAAKPRRSPPTCARRAALRRPRRCRPRSAPSPPTASRPAAGAAASSAPFTPVGSDMRAACGSAAQSALSADEARGADRRPRRRRRVRAPSRGDAPRAGRGPIAGRRSRPPPGLGVGPRARGRARGAGDDGGHIPGGRDRARARAIRPRTCARTPPGRWGGSGRAGGARGAGRAPRPRAGGARRRRRGARTPGEPRSVEALLRVLRSDATPRCAAWPRGRSARSRTSARPRGWRPRSRRMHRPRCARWRRGRSRSDPRETPRRRSSPRSAAIRARRAGDRRVGARRARGAQGRAGACPRPSATESREVRATAAWALGQMELAAPRSARQGAQGRGREVRLTAAWALSQIGDAQTVPAVTAALRTETHDKVRQAEIRALVQSGKPPDDAMKACSTRRTPRRASSRCARWPAAAARGRGPGRGPGPAPRPSPRTALNAEYAEARRDRQQGPRTTAASGAGFTPAERAGGLGGAPLAPPSSMKSRELAVRALARRSGPWPWPWPWAPPPPRAVTSNAEDAEGNGEDAGNTQRTDSKAKPAQRLRAKRDSLPRSERGVWGVRR